MTRSAVCCLLGLVLAGASCPPKAGAHSEAAPEVRRARDGNIAIRQELDAAREAKTIEAYDLFIARHPRHPLAKTARRERDRLPRR